MDWKKLYLDANGRIGQKDFWIGWLILFVVGIVLGMVTAGAPVVSAIIGLVLIYPGVCLFSKRLHDFGKSGWLAAIPYGISGAVQVLALLTAFGVMSGMASGNAAMAGGAMAGLMGFGLFALIALCVVLAFLLWVGLSKGDPGENQYGPPPTPLIGGATTPAA